MNMYSAVRELYKKPKANLGNFYKERLITWRQEPVVIRVDRPTRIDRARSLGYRAKKGFIVLRVRILRGGRQRPMIVKGRKPKNFRQKLVLRSNYQMVAEARANKKYPNLEVLNSYWVAKDGTHYWFEVIMVDPNAPEIKADKRINWVSKNKNTARVYRGLTSAGKRSRGLMR